MSAKPRKPAAHLKPREPDDAIYELARFMKLYGVTPALAAKLLFVTISKVTPHLEKLEFNGRIILSRPGVYVADLYAPLE